jgi:hypothetical protein
MDTYLQKGFYANQLSGNFRYNMSFFKNVLNEHDIKLDNIEKEIIYCKNEVDYIKGFIDHIKERVIKKCKNLSSVKIMLATFDKNNIMHKFMIAISDMVTKLLQMKEKPNIYESIIVIIEYEGQTAFIGELNFTGL